MLELLRQRCPIRSFICLLPWAPTDAESAGADSAPAWASQFSQLTIHMWRIRSPIQGTGFMLTVTMLVLPLKEWGGGDGEEMFSSESYLPSSVLGALQGSDGESDFHGVTRLGVGELDLNSSCWAKEPWCIPHSPPSLTLAAFVEGQCCAQACVGVSGRYRENGQPVGKIRPIYCYCYLLLYVC